MSDNSSTPLQNNRLFLPDRPSDLERNWYGDILIAQENTKPQRGIIDLDTHSNNFLRLLQYLSTTGDFHRRLIPGTNRYADVQTNSLIL